MNPIDTLLQCLDLIIEGQLWPEKKASEILKILMYVNNKGWLYTSSVEGKLKAVICAYKIKEGDSLTQMPIKEEGNILYVPFVLSIEKNVNLFHIIRESCKLYLEENPEVEEIILEDKNNQIKRYKLGENNGKRTIVTTSSNANISN